MVFLKRCRGPQKLPIYFQVTLSRKIQWVKSFRGTHSNFLVIFGLFNLLSLYTIYTKGQIILEAIFLAFKSPKKQTKSFAGFLSQLRKWVQSKKSRHITVLISEHRVFNMIKCLYFFDLADTYQRLGQKYSFVFCEI